MHTEEPRPLPEDLFDSSTATYREALDQLREHLIRVGYNVHRRAARETTLRVYLDEGIDYPLLNPRFTALPINDDDGEATDEEVFPAVAIAILSKEGDSSLDDRLREFPSGDGYMFLPPTAEMDGGGYKHHGHFVLELSLRDVNGIETIDFPPIVSGFRTIRRFLLGEEVSLQASEPLID